MDHRGGTFSLNSPPSEPRVWPPTLQDVPVIVRVLHIGVRDSESLSGELVRGEPLINSKRLVDAGTALPHYIEEIHAQPKQKSRGAQPHEMNGRNGSGDGQLRHHNLALILENPQRRSYSKLSVIVLEMKSTAKRQRSETHFRSISERPVAGQRKATGETTRACKKVKHTIRPACFIAIPPNSRIWGEIVCLHITSISRRPQQ